MRTWVLAFLLGDASLLFFSSLPAIYIAYVLLGTSVMALFLSQQKYMRLLMAAILGFAWGLLHADWQLATQWPAELESKSISVIGTVVSIPETHDQGISFEFLLQQPRAVRVRLGWYQNTHSNQTIRQTAPAQIHIGDTWRLMIRLKKPRGFWNQGGFDYQAWLFEHRIRATGYVVTDANNQPIKMHAADYKIDSLRTQLAANVTQILHDKPCVGLINALTVGVRHQISEAQWQVMRGTGTNHLFAIAGLHIGFVSGMIFALVSFIWRRIGQWSLYIPTPQAAALAALVVAIFYSALAGFALPTQRAILMLSVFLITTLLRKQLAAWTAWSLALLIVLIINPLMILSDSFWLSFGATAYIIYGISARLHVGKWWQQWARVQWVVAVGLIPLTLLFFHQISLASFLANAFAIPWVGFVVLPLCLSGSLLGLMFPKLGSALILLSETMLEWLWPWLESIAKWDQAQWLVYISNPWVLLTASIAMLLLLAPRGFPARWLGIIWLLPLIMWKPAMPKQGEIWFTLLDVGQGLASVVQTQHHTLIYDTGPKLSDSFDTGNAVVVPFLNYHGIQSIDMLVVSHPDNDHIGGANSILTQFDVKQILTSAPEKFKPEKNKAAMHCVAGQHWQWDGVHFEILYPAETMQGLDNDSSCVLRIDNGKQSILLVGDIEKASEHYLVANQVNKLPATILVAPHHGSKTSSTIEFINAVHPQYVLFPVGYRNKFGFPKAEILQRYQQIAAKIFTTVDVGEIAFKLNAQSLPVIQTYRDCYLRFWN